MEENIYLHPERGLDPHMCKCPRCGADSGVTVGRVYKAKSSKGLIYANTQNRHKMSQQLNEMLTWLPVDEHESIPILCGSCEQEMAEIAAVATTGAAFRCTECGIEGAIRKSEFTNFVRQRTATPEFETCGLEFNACHEHNELGITLPERVVH